MHLVAVVLLLAGLCRSDIQPGSNSCFCEANEPVYEYPCTLTTVDLFNNRKIFPLLQSLLHKDFFRYYKVNMLKPCPFWPDDKECASKECGIETCDDQVPAGLRKPAREQHFYKNEDTDDTCENSNNFDPIDTSLSSETQEQLDHMDCHDEHEHKFCDVGDENDGDMHYVDLSKNPERYTGYKGNSAQKVWSAIYRENCFKPNMKFDKNFLLHPTTTGLCLEKRVFFRFISGLHTAITISVAAHNYKPADGFGGPNGEGSWFRNVEMFKWRFSAETTNGEGPLRLKNLYFVYLLQLRALVKAAPYLRKELFYTGNEMEDRETREAVDQLLAVAHSFDGHFDETTMFTGNDADARSLREEFRLHFVNISRIMDCVACDKCRLWGKLQTHGMGTALKILFADLPRGHKNRHNQKQQQMKNGNRPFQLTRNEVVALLQSFGRYASSVHEVAQFRDIINSSSASASKPSQFR